MLGRGEILSQLMLRERVIALIFSISIQGIHNAIRVFTHYFRLRRRLFSKETFMWHRSRFCSSLQIIRHTCYSGSSSGLIDGPDAILDAHCYFILYSPATLEQSFCLGRYIYDSTLVNFFKAHERQNNGSNSKAKLRTHFLCKAFAR